MRLFAPLLLVIAASCGRVAGGFGADEVLHLPARKQGTNVALVRNLTDSLYNPAGPPYVSHFEGTRLLIAHVERYWRPGITSYALLGGEPFRFQGDVTKD